ncbi:MAG TPA: hypothetical protein VD731_06420 [Nitrosopumilaceae archaeon]|nr:hypothetical protein [Nitrosopumilaceae archaeon]
MNDWWGITKENQLKKYQKKTNQFINELESTLDNFENKADIKELSSKLKESIKKFQEESKD